MILEEETTVTSWQVALPNFTDAPSAKLFPVIVMVSPPLLEPVDGVTAEITGSLSIDIVLGFVLRPL